jgi:uncharacterized membrane protein YeiB
MTGPLARTHDLTQSAVCVTLFYNSGPGRIAEWSLVAQAAFILVLFARQLAVSLF